MCTFAHVTEVLLQRQSNKKGLDPANGFSPNSIYNFKVLADSNNCDNGWYWSGTKSQDENNQAWFFDVNRGSVGVGDDYILYSFAIRAVVNRDAPTGIGEVLAEDGACVSFVNGTLSIHSNVSVEALEVWSVNGQKVRSVAMPNKTVSLIDLPNGMYVVKLKGSKGTIATQKVLKRR